MNISISNIAWDKRNDDEVSSILKKYDLKHIDIAPTKYFPSPSMSTDSDIFSVKEYWDKQGISIIGMQSLLFGTQGLNVFSDAENQDKMLSHLSSICHIGKLLDAKKLVFGSPRNRDRSLLNDDETRIIAIDFFNRLGDIAEENNVIICLEPNPTCYNSNFMVDSLETASVVKSINHSHIKMQLDVGAMYINNEDPNIIIPDVCNLVGHIHISEPQLSAINAHNEYHHKVAPLLSQFLPEKDITIEMLTSSETQSSHEINNSIEFVIQTYKEMVA
ncbi:sugar phosphate isomerase/epimerase [Photobacterium sp. SDRW27]|uniref:sugar phosphate isomerase/epimerase family protein n=1 Tax=Photobacterium obscurum TaxID=2829490 RepID=UPI002243919A|nr:sugar phosphate isomerase/epimerase [Photobacterium obscurum]MCW8327455.1 sugar phosphate isomerase/epimerase [Photobacterium obscurum]